VQPSADFAQAHTQAEEEADFAKVAVSDDADNPPPTTDRAQQHRDLLYEATLNESDRRAETGRLRAELARRDKVATEIRIWGALALTIVLAILSAVGTAFFYFDRKFADHVASTNATEKASEKNTAAISVLEKETKANTTWIQDVQGEQKAFEQSQRAEGMHMTIELNNLKNDMTNLRGHR
jgi:hypothetical protein